MKTRKIGFSPYKDTIKELLPRSYKIEQVTHKRRMFLTMLNEFLPHEAKIQSPHEVFYQNDLHFILHSKIFSLFQVRGLKPHKAIKVKNIYVKESMLFNQFFKLSSHPLARFFSRNTRVSSTFSLMSNYTHPAAILISMIFDGKQIKMMLDINELFARTVFNRIKPASGAKVKLEMPYINIKERNGETTRLIPTWKKLHTHNLQFHKKEINGAFKSMAQEGLDKCYLLYPKQDDFKKHIEIKGSNSKKIKLIPYSFTYTNKMQLKTIAS